MNAGMHPDALPNGALSPSTQKRLQAAGRSGRDLQPGDQAWTGFNGGKTPTLVTITGRYENESSQSRIMFTVSPGKLRGDFDGARYDADWFWPANGVERD